MDWIIYLQLFLQILVTFTAMMLLFFALPYIGLKRLYDRLYSPFKEKIDKIDGIETEVADMKDSTKKSLNRFDERVKEMDVRVNKIMDFLNRKFPGPDQPDENS